MTLCTFFPLFWGTADLKRLKFFGFIRRYFIRIHFFQKQIATILNQETCFAVHNNGLANTHNIRRFWGSTSQIANSLFQTVFSAPWFLYVLLERKLQKSSSKPCLICDYICVTKSFQTSIWYINTHSPWRYGIVLRTAYRLPKTSDSTECKRNCQSKGKLTRLYILKKVYLGRSRFWWGNLRKRDQWGEPDVDGRIILRRIFRKWEGVVGTGWVGSG